MSNQEILSRLQKQHHEGQAKYIYFLLAASGACIAYSLEKAQGTPLIWNLIFLGGALLFWALSFISGCLLIQRIQALIGANATKISLVIGNHEKQPQHDIELKAAQKGVKTAINQNMERATCFMKLQFWLFVLAGVFFIIWRISEIIRIAPH